MLRQVLRRARHDDRGISMAELLVASSVSVLILATLGGFFVASIRGSASNANTDTNLRQATNSINAMSRYLRAATTRAVPTSLVPDAAVVKATPTDLTFYAYINLIDDADIAKRTAEKPVLARYYVDSASRQLVQQLSACSADANGYYSCPAVTSTTRLGGPIASPTSDGVALFTYQNADSGSLAPVGGQLSASDRAAVRFVTVNLELGSATPGAGSNAHLQNTVGLLNLGRAGAIS
ncbi:MULTISPECIES: hypothetical protein [unclassified Curtobacterium]|uniref:hypothetical protein n=1 Tax=unclassified Curtobacterium TaxID=257496 RepID=UPI000D9446ED|nr:MULTISPECIES: hypothetical protein [unclassified Curtobacterium]PYY41529.1 hypothetical protein DEJ32_04065 [Curtobacterium sp. MCPF17_046]PYY51641.1 hypothetical protein DEI84_00585 [Curtobacterium sp. MCBD17_023]